MGKSKNLVSLLGFLLLGVIPALGAEIHEAVKKGDINKVKSILAENPDQVNAKANGGWTPLHLAAERGNKDVIELLIAKGAQVNAKDKFGSTPLHCAAWMGQKDVAELLIAKGVNVNAKDQHGQTPLHMAAHEGRKEVADLMEGMKVRGARFVFASDHSISTLVDYEDYACAVEAYREHMMY